MTWQWYGAREHYYPNGDIRDNNSHVTMALVLWEECHSLALFTTWMLYAFCWLVAHYVEPSSSIHMRCYYCILAIINFFKSLLATKHVCRPSIILTLIFLPLPGRRIQIFNDVNSAWINIHWIDVGNNISVLLNELLQVVQYREKAFFIGIQFSGKCIMGFQISFPTTL